MMLTKINNLDTATLWQRIETTNALLTNSAISTRTRIELGRELIELCREMNHRTLQLNRRLGAGIDPTQRPKLALQRIQRGG